MSEDKSSKLSDRIGKASEEVKASTKPPTQVVGVKTITEGEDSPVKAGRK